MKTSVIVNKISNEIYVYIFFELRFEFSDQIFDFSNKVRSQRVPTLNTFVKN